MAVKNINELWKNSVFAYTSAFLGFENGNFTIEHNMKNCRKIWSAHAARSLAAPRPTAASSAASQTDYTIYIKYNKLHISYIQGVNHK